MQFNVSAFDIYNKEWALLTAGSAEGYNTMTISWGGLGTLWGKPVATVYVRPSRYTYEFMEKNETFTVSFYPQQCRPALELLGTKSGRDGDKVAEAGLTPVFLPNGVTFREARVTLVCKKIYFQDLDMANMPANVQRIYADDGKPHRMYIGEVVAMLPDTPAH